LQQNINTVTEKRGGDKDKRLVLDTGIPRGFLRPCSGMQGMVEGLIPIVGDRAFL
jgi:hypothetical protein